MAWSTSLTLDANGIPYILYSDGAYDDKATVMKWDTDSQSRVVVGYPGFSPGRIASASIIVDNNGTPLVACGI